MLAAAHSVPRTDALEALTQAGYDVGERVTCTFLSRGLNDTFLVRTGEASAAGAAGAVGAAAETTTRAGGRRAPAPHPDRYILRVYRAGWRTAAEIRYELDLLTHLQHRLPPGVAVSTPILRRDGTLFHAVKAPEGTRHLALFTYAPGAPPTWAGHEQSAAYGAAVAALHNASDDFTSPHSRFAVDLAYLVDAPLHSLRPRMQHRTADFTYVQRVAARLRRRIHELEGDLTWGAGHADLQAKNAHVTNAKAPPTSAQRARTGGTFTFFDFDCGGPTWRAFDLSWYRMEAAQSKEPGQWGAFLRGYRGQRELSRADHLAIPWFVLAIHIWWMGLIADLGPQWGTSWFDSYLTQQIGALRRWEATHLAGK